MKHTPLYFLFLFFAAFACHAEQVPIVVIDSKTCQVKGWHNMGGCFKNSTGEDARKFELYLRQTIHYSDKRTPIVATIVLTPYHMDRYTLISTSTDVFSKNSIKKVVDEIVTRDGKVLEGCKFEINEANPMTQKSITNSLTCV